MFSFLHAVEKSQMTSAGGHKMDGSWMTARWHGKGWKQWSAQGWGRTGLCPSDCAAAACRGKARAAHILVEISQGAKTVSQSFPGTDVPRIRLYHGDAGLGVRPEYQPWIMMGPKSSGNTQPTCLVLPVWNRARDSEHAEDLHNCFSSWQAAWTFTSGWPWGGRVSLVNDKDFLLLSSLPILALVGTE